MPLPLSYNIRSLIVRGRVTLLAVVGIALVIAVLVVLTAMANGFRTALAATGSLDNAIVTQQGSGTELTSGIALEAAQALMTDSRVLRTPDGQLLASPELVVIGSFPRKDGQDVNVSVRGVTPIAFTVRQGIRIAEGRQMQPGLYEIVVGRALQRRMAGMDVGKTLKMQRKTWTIVGIFEAGGSGFESEVWGDLDAMAAAFNRRGGYQSVTVRMADAATIRAFDADLRRDPRMKAQAVQERKYYADQSGSVAGQLQGLAVFVAVVMGVGAVFGAMNTMYAIVAARTREIGTLRALGFSKAAILTSFVLESAFLAAVGGAIGCVLALPFNGITSAAGGDNFAEIAFAFRISTESVVLGMVLALLMGVAGGLLPAVRAARLPITAALRD